MSNSIRLINEDMVRGAIVEQSRKKKIFVYADRRICCLTIYATAFTIL
jgi:hypothetical protein